MFSNFFFLEYRVVYGVMWKKYSTAGEAIDDSMVQSLFTLGTNGHKHTLTEYVIPIALPPQQLFHERARMLRYTYIACRVIFTSLLCVYLRNDFIPGVLHTNSPT